VNVEKRRILTDLGLCSNCGACIFTRDLSPCPQVNIDEKLYENPIPNIDGSFITRSRDTKILEVAQDGGTVTTIVKFLLEHKIVDQALLLKLGKNLTPVPVIVTRPDDALTCAGSKYIYAPLLTKLGDLFKSKSVVIVGLPCHMRALSIIEKGIKDVDIFKIGLLCSHNFKREMYIELSKKFNFNIDNIVKMGIKKNMFKIFLNDGKIIEVPLKDLEKYVLKCCKQCPELIPNYVDIAVGSMFAPDKHNVVFTISRRGREIVERCHSSGVIELKDMDGSVRDKIFKIARKKADNARKFRDESVKLLRSNEIIIT